MLLFDHDKYTKPVRKLYETLIHFSAHIFFFLLDLWLEVASVVIPAVFPFEIIPRKFKGTLGGNNYFAFLKFKSGMILQIAAVGLSPSPLRRPLRRLQPDNRPGPQG